MKLTDFDFELPSELIAQEPLTVRDASRMLVVQRATGTWADNHFRNLPDLLNAGDAIILNNTRVFPARLLGHRLATGKEDRVGAAVEAFLLRPLSPLQQTVDEDVQEIVEWEVLVRPGRAFRLGAQLVFGGGRLRAEVIDILPEGRRRLRFEAAGKFERLVDEIGETPLPPYIKRESSGDQRVQEPRYQTIYASQRGAIAAPTAGLHFTVPVLDQLREKGLTIVEITHHVGYATFQPIRVERVEDHHIEEESYEISPAAAAQLNGVRQAGGRLIAVGTTCVRALESAAEADGTIRAERKPTSLFIYPGYRFRGIDGLLTNFHLPQSSLLMLVSAFGGQATVRQAYQHAVQQRYRFYSYGDCMLLI
jgi:S-adenosylmethionine:tRNA ribosyltransferase-isomerase